MRVLLIAPPFRTPTAPVLGPATLKAVVERDVPNGHVEVLDWNLALVRRAMTGDLADLCDVCPVAGLACPRPGLLQHAMERTAAQLRQIPEGPEEFAEHQRAAVLLDGLLASLHRCSEALLRPFAEGRRALPEFLVENWLAPLHKTIEDRRPDRVGLSVLSEQSLLWAVALARHIHGRYSLPVDLGGSLISHLDPREILHVFPWIDTLFLGEADLSYPAFLERGAGDCEGIAGIAWRRGKKILVHPPDHQVDADSLPTPDFSDTPLDGYLLGRPTLPYASSRGCSWGRCAFCSHTLPHGKGARMRHPDLVVADLRSLLSSTGATTFLFVDENLRSGRVSRLSRAIIDAELPVHLGFEGIRPERAFDAETLDLARRAGLRWVYVGVESLTQRLLDGVSKGTRVDDILTFLERCDHAGIVAHCSFIAGLPGQTEEDLRGELDQLAGRVLDGGALGVYHGSPMEQDPSRYGLELGGRTVLIRGLHGAVHGPSYRYSLRDGMTADVAMEVYRAHPSTSGHKPYLGECDAVVLSSTDFFSSPDQPADLKDLVARTAWAGCAFASTGRSLDQATCLEMAGRPDEALRLLGGARRSDASEKQLERLRAHRLTCLVELGQLGVAREELGGLPLDSAAGQAAAGQAMRIAIATGDLTLLERSANALLHAGLVGFRVRLALGLVHFTASRYPEALHHLDAAQEIDDSDPQLLQLLARCCTELGQRERSQRIQNRVRRRWPHLAEQPPAG